MEIDTDKKKLNCVYGFWLKMDSTSIYWLYVLCVAF